MPRNSLSLAETHMIWLRNYRPEKHLEMASCHGAWPDVDAEICRLAPDGMDREQERDFVHRVRRNAVINAVCAIARATSLYERPEIRLKEKAASSGALRLVDQIDAFLTTDQSARAVKLDRVFLPEPPTYQIERDAVLRAAFALKDALGAYETAIGGQLTAAATNERFLGPLFADHVSGGLDALTPTPSMAAKARIVAALWAALDMPDDREASEKGTIIDWAEKQIKRGSKMRQDFSERLVLPAN